MATQTARVTLLPGPARRWVLLSSFGALGVAAGVTGGSRPAITTVVVVLSIVAGFSALWSP